MTGEVGNSLRQLGQADQAAAVLNEALALFDGSLPRGRMGYLIALADVLARPGQQRRPDPRPLPAPDPPHQVPAVRDFVARARELVPTAC